MPRGRPKNGQQSKTGMVRVRADVEEMIRWICRIENVTSSDLIDPLVRQRITEQFEKYRPIIDQIKMAEKQAKPSKT